MGCFIVYTFTIFGVCLSISLGTHSDITHTLDFVAIDHEARFTNTPLFRQRNHVRSLASISSPSLKSNFSKFPASHFASSFLSISKAFLLPRIIYHENGTNFSNNDNINEKNVVEPASWNLETPKVGNWNFVIPRVDDWDGTWITPAYTTTPSPTLSPTFALNTITRPYIDATFAPTIAPTAPTFSPTASYIDATFDATVTPHVDAPGFPSAFPSAFSPTFSPTFIPDTFPFTPTSTDDELECFKQISHLAYNESTTITQKAMSNFCSSSCAKMIANQEFYKIICFTHNENYCYPKYMAYLNAIKNPTASSLELACEDIECLRNMTESIAFGQISDSPMQDTNLEVKTFLEAMYGIDMACLKVDNVRCYPIIFQMDSSNSLQCACWTAVYAFTEAFFPDRHEVAVQKNAKDFFCSVDQQGTLCGENTGNFFTNNPCPELNGSNPYCSPICRSMFSHLEGSCCLDSLVRFSENHIAMHYGTEPNYVRNWVQHTCELTIPDQKCVSHSDISNHIITPRPDVSVTCYQEIFRMIDNIIQTPTKKNMDLLCNSACFSRNGLHKMSHGWMCTKIKEDYCYPKLILLDKINVTTLDYACDHMACLEKMTEVTFMMDHSRNQMINQEDLLVDLGHTMNGIEIQCLKVNNKYCLLEYGELNNPDMCECFGRFEEITTPMFSYEPRVKVQQKAANFFCSIDEPDEEYCNEQLNNFFLDDPCPKLNGSDVICPELCTSWLKELSHNCCLNALVEFAKKHTDLYSGAEIGFVQTWMENSCGVTVPSFCGVKSPSRKVESSTNCHSMHSDATKPSSMNNWGQSCMKVKVSPGQLWSFDFQADVSATVDELGVLVWPDDSCSFLPDSNTLLYTRGEEYKDNFIIPPHTSVISVVVSPYGSTPPWKVNMCLKNISDISKNNQHECSSDCRSGIQSVKFRYIGQGANGLIVQSDTGVSVIPKLKTNNGVTLVTKTVKPGFEFKIRPNMRKTFQSSVEFYVAGNMSYIIDTTCGFPMQMRPGTVFGNFQIIETINGNGMKMCARREIDTKKSSNSSFLTLPLYHDLLHIYSMIPTKLSLLINQTKQNVKMKKRNASSPNSFVELQNRYNSYRRNQKNQLSSSLFPLQN